MEEPPRQGSSVKCFFCSNHVSSLYFCLFNEAVKFLRITQKEQEEHEQYFSTINLFLIQNRNSDDNRRLNQYLFCYTGSQNTWRRRRGREKKSHLLFLPFLTLNLKNWSHRSCASAEFHVQRKALLIQYFFELLLTPNIHPWIHMPSLALSAHIFHILRPFSTQMCCPPML